MSTESEPLLAATGVASSPADIAKNGVSNVQDEEVIEPVYLGTIKLVPISIAMGLAIFILGLDNTIVGTATPTITNEFHSLTGIGWYGSAYRVTTCSTQFFYGKLYEQFRVKWIFVMSVVILELGSVVCASAPTSTAFILGRAIAGCGASGIVTGVFIAISHSVPLRLRPIFNSTVGALECVAMTVAPVIGGALTTYASWRWCFWINLPIGVFTIVAIVLLFENPENQTVSKGSTVSKLQQLNIPNLLLFTASVVCLLLALEWGGTSYHWTSGRIFALLVVSTGLLVAFVGLEAIQKEQATIPASIILNKTAGLCVLYAFCASAAFNVVDYFLPIWFQAIKGASAAESGQMLLPSVISLSIAAFSSGFVVATIGHYTPHMILGSTLMGVGFGFLTTLTPSTGPTAWIGWQVLFGLGMGLAIPQPWSAIQTALAASEIPLGMTAVSFAISIGAALSTSVSQNVFANLLRKGLQNVPGVDAHAILHSGVTDLLKIVPDSERAHVIGIYNSALTSTFWVCVIVVVLGMIAALCMDWNSVTEEETEDA
ncbi:MFS toxin efflux pump [Apiospora arundinis]|uniref:MFS toxin efflux pump n=1 Tax=Apiospora arundinis TaxID=335852 RepID=A0ABR2JJ15_9PEZI